MLRIGIDAREIQGRRTGTGRYLWNLLRIWSTTTDCEWILYFKGAPPDDARRLGGTVTCRALSAGGPGIWWQEVQLAASARADRLGVFFAPAYMCPLTLDVPRVTAIHDLSFFSVPHDFAWADGLRRRLQVAAAVDVSSRLLACSAFTVHEISARFPAAVGRVRHVPLAAAADLPVSPGRDAARARLAVETPYLVTVGAVFNRRHLPDLLRAVVLLRRRWPALVLDVVGENRTHPPIDLVRLVDSLGLADAVRLSGFVDDEGLVTRYAAADVAIFLSDYEGFGLPALEAAAQGVPLVVADRPSLSEIVGPAALLVEPEDPVGIAQAIERLLSDPESRRRCAERGRAVASLFSWTRTADLTLQALREAASS